MVECRDTVCNCKWIYISIMENVRISSRVERYDTIASSVAMEMRSARAAAEKLTSDCGKADDDIYHPLYS